MGLCSPRSGAGLVAAGPESSGKGERGPAMEAPRVASRRGEIPERSKGADCKSAAVVLRRFESSSPHQKHERDHPTGPRRRAFRKCVDFETTRAGVAQWLERQPSKLRVAGSNPVSRSKFLGLRRIEIPRRLAGSASRRAASPASPTWLSGRARPW